MSDNVRAGNSERGWNEPPVFLHNAPPSSTNLSNKKTILNKRVSHTLDGTVSSDIDSDNKQKTLSQPPKSTSFQNSTTSGNTANDEQIQTETISVLSVAEIEDILNSKIELCKASNLSAKICDDISKRVKIFVSNWTKLNENVKIKMSTLATALKNFQYNQANDIHIVLMLDYPSEVSQWMVGIKRLIHELTNFENSKKEETN